MLVQKRLSTKKLIIYGLIIALTMGATGFTLYQNRTADNEQPLADQFPAVENSVLPGGLAGRPSGANKLTGEHELDLNIFNNEKFKALNENVLISQDKSVLGKRDPFKPN